MFIPIIFLGRNHIHNGLNIILQKYSSTASDSFFYPTRSAFILQHRRR